jgi:Putative adhesin
MTTFETPTPIAVSLDLGVGDIRVTASDRTDTVVDVRPSDPASTRDVAAAEQTQVELAGGRLLIKAPKGWKHYTPWGGRESIDVTVEVPSGSRVDGEAGVAAFRSTGRLDECRYKTGAGEIHVDHAGAVVLRTGAGDVTLDRAAGRAVVTTGSGALQIGSVDGPAVVKNSNGETWIGEVTGDVRARAANGKITVDRPRATVAAKTANGDIVLGTVTHGQVVAETAYGKVDIGVAGGVAAWLELHTSFGNVRNGLESADGPGAGDDSVEIRARTGFGDITIRRSPAEQIERSAS